MSIKQNNFAAFNAARVQLAKALAGGDLSQKEIQAAGGDPSILGQLADVTSTAFTGTPTVDTQKKIEATVKAIRKVALQKGRAEIEALALKVHSCSCIAFDHGSIAVRTWHYWSTVESMSDFLE